MWAAKRQQVENSSISSCSSFALTWLGEMPSRPTREGGVVKFIKHTVEKLIDLHSGQFT